MPTANSRIRALDHLPALTAARLAWSDPGREPHHHEAMKREVREKMPLLARALDKAEREHLWHTKQH